MSGKHLNVDMKFTADTSQAKSQVQNLQKLLSEAMNQASVGISGKGISAEINKAKLEAAELKVKLQDALKTDGSIDLIKFNKSLEASGKTLGDYGKSLSQLGTSGKQAFLELTQSISNTNVTLSKSNGMINALWTTLKNVARFQISSSAIHTFVGSIQSAYNYAQHLNESLNNIRIITGQSADEMDAFAEKANKAARRLNTTTLDYTNASLIYYQQGLDDSEVAKRTETTLKLANVSRQSAETVSSQLTAIWNNFDHGTRSLESYVDIITALGASTAASSEEIADGVSKFAAVADTVGLSYEYATAALATLVSETRQSADTVGNGLRTLFSRFQSLSLGETLEDGTDLTKYSSALASIGVNIKTQNGELKRMDQILSELGDKWESISKDQQVALAQTIGGVRQYVNLVALLDNKDKFQANISIAQNSEGTLQEQADIYAESWEASRDRVKTAAEAIYSSLINDDAFIKINKATESTLNGIKNLIDTLGGLPGVLTTVGSIFLTAFGPQLSKSIDNLIERINFLNGTTENKIIKMQKDANSALGNLYAGSTSTSGKMAHTAYSSQGQMSNAVLDAQLDKTRTLTDEQKKILSLLQQQHGVIVENTVETGKVLEQEQQKFETISNQIKIQGKKLETNNKDFSKASWLTNANDQIQNAFINNKFHPQKIQEEYSKVVENVTKEINKITRAAGRAGEKLEEYLKSKGYSDEAIKKFQALAATIKDHSTSYEKIREQLLDLAKVNTSTFNSADLEKNLDLLKEYAAQLGQLTNASNALNRFSSKNSIGSVEDVQALQVALANIQSAADGAGKTIEQALGTAAAKNYKSLLNIISQTPNDFKAIDKAVQKLNNSLDNMKSKLKTDEKNAFEALRKALTILYQDADKADKKIEEIKKELEDLKNIEEKAAESTGNLGSSFANMKQFLEQNKQNIASTGQYILQLTRGFSSLASVINNIQGLYSTWADENKTLGDKVLATATSMGTLSMSASMMITSFGEAKKHFGAFQTLTKNAATGILGLSSKIGIGKQALAGLTAGTAGFGTALATVIATVGIAAVAIAAISAVCIAVYKDIKADEIAINNFNKAIDTLKGKADEAKESANKLNQAINNYDEAQKKLAECTATTEEWKKAFDDLQISASGLLELLKENLNPTDYLNALSYYAEYGKINPDDIKKAQQNSQNKVMTGEVATATATYQRNIKQIEIDQGKLLEELKEKLNAIFMFANFKKDGNNVQEFDNALQHLIENFGSQNINNINDFKDALASLGIPIDQLQDLKEVKEWFIELQEISEQAETANKEFKIAQNPSIISNLSQEDRTNTALINTIVSANSQLINKEFNNLFNDYKNKASLFSQANNDVYEELIKALQQFMGEENVKAVWWNPVQGTDQERKFIYKDAEGKRQEIDAETAASYLAAAKIALEASQENSEASKALEEAAQSYRDIRSSVINSHDGDQAAGEIVDTIINKFKSGTKEFDFSSILLKNIGNGNQAERISNNLAKNNEIDNAIQEALGLTYDQFESLAILLVGDVDIAIDNLKANLETISEVAENSFSDLPQIVQNAVNKISNVNNRSYADKLSIGQALEKSLSIGTDLSTFNALQEVFKNAGTEAGKLAQYFLSMGWPTEDIKDLIPKLREFGIDIKDIEDQSSGVRKPLEELIELMRQAAEINFDNISKKISDFKSIIDSLSSGKTITADQYNFLAKLAPENSNFRNSFQRDAEGNYSFNGLISELQELFNNSVFKELTNAINQNNIKLDKLEGLKNLNVDNLYNFLKDNTGKYTQQSIDYLRFGGYQDVGQLNTWQDKLNKQKFLNEDDIQALNNALKEFENHEITIEQLMQACVETGQDFSDILKGLSFHVFDDDIKGQLEDEVKFIKQYGESLYGLNKELIDTDEEFKLVAEAILRVEDAAKTSKDKMEEWTDILNNFDSVGIDVQAETMKELADTYGDLLNLSQESTLSDEFLQSAYNLTLMKAALEGNTKAFDELLEIAKRNGGIIEAAYQALIDKIGAKWQNFKNNILGSNQGGVAGGYEPSQEEKIKSFKPIENVTNDSSIIYQSKLNELTLKQAELAEIVRQKERAYGQEKIELLNKEIELRKQTINLTEEYQEKLRQALAQDKQNLLDKFNAAGVKTPINFDEQTGAITNYANVMEGLATVENYWISRINEANARGDENTAIFEENRTVVQAARQAIETYNSTLDKCNDELYKVAQAMDELHDKQLEIITTKVDMKIDVNTMEAKLFSYYMEKVSDDTYTAADRMRVLGEQLQNALSKADTYRNGIAQIFDLNNLDINNFDLSQIQTAVKNGGLNSNDVKVLQEYYNQLIDVNSYLLQMQRSQEQAIQTAQKNIESLNSSIRSLEKQIQSYEKSIQKAYKQIDSYNMSIEDAARQIESYERSIAKAEKQIQSYEKSIAKAERQIQSYERSIAKAEKQIESYNRSIEKAERQIQSYERSIAKAEKQIESYERSIVKAGKQIESYERSIAKAEKQIVKLGKSIEKAGRQIEDLNRSIQKAEKQILSYEKSIAKAEKQIVKLGRSIEKAYKQISNLEKSIYKAEKQIVSYEKSIAKAEKQIKSYEKSIVKAEKQIVNLNKSIAKAEKQITEYEKSITETYERIDELRESITKAYKDIAKAEEARNAAAFAKVNEKIKEQNELIKEQNNLYNNYSTVLQTYRDITNLMGKSINKDTQKLIKDLNNAMINNSKNKMTMAKQSMEELTRQRAEAEKRLNEALDSNNKDMVKQYKDILKQLDNEIQSYQDLYLSSWKDTMTQVQEIFKTAVESMITEFEEAMSGSFGSLNYLKDAFNRQSELDNNYLKDYDKLYELNKLQRTLNESLVKSNNAGEREKLLELQKEITSLQASGVQMSQYDIDALKAKIELQQSYNDLQNTRDAKSTVRLSKDSKGNWGYIYTSNSDEVSKAEQDYEDKLNAYQKLNDKYMDTLQSKALETQATYRDVLKEIMTDMTLTEEQRKTRVEELNNWLINQQNYFNDQMTNSFQNQSGIAALGSTFSWLDTKLSKLTGTNSLSEYNDIWNTNSQNLFNGINNSIGDYHDQLNEILKLAGTDISNWNSSVGSIISIIGQQSDATTISLLNLADTISESFSEAYEEYADQIENLNKQIEEYNKQIEKAYEQIENYKESIQDTIEQIEDYREQIEDTIESIEDYKESIQDTIDSIEDYKESIQDTYDAIEDYKDQINETKESIDDYREQIEETKESIDDYRESIEDTKRSIEDYREQIEETYEQIEDYKEQIEDTKRSIDDYRESIEDTKRSIDDYRESIEDTYIQIEDYKIQIEDTKIQMDDYRDSIEDTKIQIDNYRQSIIDTYDQIEDYKEQIVETRIQIEDYRRSIYKTELQIDDYRDAINETYEQINEYNDAIIDSQNQIAAQRIELAKNEKQLQASKAWIDKNKDSIEAATSSNELCAASVLALTQALVGLSDDETQNSKDQQKNNKSLSESFTLVAHDASEAASTLIGANNRIIVSIGEERNAVQELIDFYYQLAQAKREADESVNTYDGYDLISCDTGGYTGAWGPEGKLAVLHEKEQVFNAKDTANLLNAAQILRQIDTSALAMSSGVGQINPTFKETESEIIQQEVHIEASFPNATNRNEIQEAFDNLVNKAVQYANRKGY